MVIHILSSSSILTRSFWQAIAAMNRLTLLYEGRLSKATSDGMDELKASLEEEKKKNAEMAERLAAAHNLEDEALQANSRLSETKKRLSE